MKLIAVRHGETEENKTGIIQGHLPGILSELGKKQAKKLAERLKDENIDLIISSDLDRAFNTAKEIAKFHKEIDFVSDKRLRERYIGSFQGKLARDVDWDNPPEDFETRKEVEKRIFELFNETLKNNFGKTVIFVGHEGINKALIRKFHETEESISNLKNQDNTCMNIFEVNKSGKVKTLLLNCTEHLK